jgi:hypothetical protein
MNDNPTKSNSKNPKSWIFNPRSMSKIQKCLIFGFLLDYWIGLDFSVQSNPIFEAENVQTDAKKN